MVDFGATAAMTARTSAARASAAITSTLAGADPATELKKAHEQFRPILERSEKA